MTFVPPKIGTGNTCRWWEGGSMNRPAQAALVSQGSDNMGGVDLAIWPPNSVTPKLKSGVRHKDDPWFRDHPEHLKNNGCWDFVEGFALVPPFEPDQPTVPAQPAVPMDDEAQEDFIVTRFQKGMDAEDIAQQLRKLSGKRWNHYTVTLCLKRRGLLDAAPEPQTEPAEA